LAKNPRGKGEWEGGEGATTRRKKDAGEKGKQRKATESRGRWGTRKKTKKQKQKI